MMHSSDLRWPVKKIYNRAFLMYVCFTKGRLRALGLYTVASTGLFVRFCVRGAAVIFGSQQ